MGNLTKSIMTTLLSLALVACGGGEKEDNDSSTQVPPNTPAVSAISPSKAQASRFLTKATFGVRESELNALTSSNVDTWLGQQLSLPQSKTEPYLRTYVSTLAPGAAQQQSFFFEIFYQNAVNAPDQLRQRVTFALSEIFVVSFLDDGISQDSLGISVYYDMLGKNSFGNFRTLIEDVTRSPIMGVYLSHLRNQKGDLKTGRVPDENYAREVMQLFTIGLYELNIDGTLKLDGTGKPIETYTNTDVTGLAKVFTGLSFGGPDTSNNRFWGIAANSIPYKSTVPMQMYSQYHSADEKTFLKKTIPANTSGDESLKIALDTLFNHPNVGPFISKQLIQRLIVSNPSPSYVKRVASKFNDNGNGVRGDMQAVVRAIYTDPEALNASSIDSDSWGKVREPVIRLTNWMRSFDAKSAKGVYPVGFTDDSSFSLGQTPMRSSSVFNFYRPGYTPPNTNIAAAGLVAPEMQITNEASVVGYLNYMKAVINNNLGSNDIQSTYENEIALASEPEKLIDRIDLLLTGQTMPSKMKQLISDSVKTVVIPTGTSATPANILAAKQNRVKLAIYLVMASPEYLIEK